MPVRILKDESSDPASLAITKEKLEQGIRNFKKHYSLYPSGSQEFSSDFSIPWNYLEQAVNDYQGQFPSVPVSEIAIRFVHCYNTATASLYLRMQICQMQATTITDYDNPVYQLLANGCESWYDVAENSIAATPSAACSFSDPVYLDSFEYTLEEGSTPQELSADGGFTYVRTLTFPWEAEIYQMYQDNGAPTDPPDNVRLHFCAASYTESEPGADAVLWPHGLVLYLEVNDEKLLDNDSTVSMFSYKGCDMATLCPPRCNGYFAPVGVAVSSMATTA
ncbi:hypothetical protein [Polluticoccus soli]|uniref:hypothetical protein n=1 Tax=Polluticoccus soli TaxID=3034150 RepID=UPI0023E1DAAC|nr:hypothetical protein [Flavipsychrobacter sp. JY13-12]